MGELNTLESMGFTLPSPVYLFGALMFGLIGFAAWRYGRKASLGMTKWLGVALMFFPYFIAETWLLYVVGVGLCIGIYFSSR